MEPEVLTKVEKIDPVAAEEAKDVVDLAESNPPSPQSKHHVPHQNGLDDDEDDVSLFEALLDGEDETYDHIRGLQYREKVLSHLLTSHQNKMSARQTRPGNIASDYEKLV
jgi:hypothetical protein